MGSVALDHCAWTAFAIMLFLPVDRSGRIALRYTLVNLSSQLTITISWACYIIESMCERKERVKDSSHAALQSHCSTSSLDSSKYDTSNSDCPAAGRVGMWRRSWSMAGASSIPECSPTVVDKCHVMGLILSRDHQVRVSMQAL